MTARQRLMQRRRPLKSGLSVTTFTQSLGAERLIDGDMEAVGTLPQWVVTAGTVAKTTLSPHSGTQALRLKSTGANASVYQATGAIAGSGALYEIAGWYRSDGTAYALVQDTGGTEILFGLPTVTWSAFRYITRFANGNLALYEFHPSPVSGYYADFDDLTFRPVTLNTAQTAPSADMRMTFLYTLPGSPVFGDEVRVLTRISSYASGNYWETVLDWTGSAWNIKLYSVSGFTRTQKASANNVGTTNAIRVTQVGDTHAIETSADGGETWTQRGSTVIGDATYQTATGVNVIYTSVVTPGAYTCTVAT